VVRLRDLPQQKRPTVRGPGEASVSEWTVGHHEAWTGAQNVPITSEFLNRLVYTLRTEPETFLIDR
jgi:hypothetical protein